MRRDGVIQFTLATLAASSLVVAPAFSQGRSGKAAPRAVLSDALKQTSNDLETQPGQLSRPEDPNQGDDNASQRAISVVCMKDTPAAHRSAICDQEPVSPE